MKRTLLLCLCALFGAASSGSLMAARKVTTVTTETHCYAPARRTVVKTYRVVPRTTYYEREHRGVSGTFRHIGGKLQMFFTGRNTIER